MLLFSSFLAAILNFNFGVRAFIPIAIGVDSSIQPNDIAGTPIWQTYPLMPSAHPGYKVTNVGNTGIRASIYWKDSWPLQTDDVFCEARSNCSSNGTTNVWYELADPVHVKPSESTVIRPSTKINFYFSRLVVISNHPENSSDPEAIVHVEYEDSGEGLTRKRRGVENSNLSVCDNVKIVFKLGGSKLPPAIVASGAEALVALFWPEHNTSVWDEVRDQVKTLIDQETFQTINALLTGRIMGFKRKLEQVAREVKEGQADVSIHYMNLAQDFIGLEEESIIRGHHNAKKLNEDLLPVYSNIILMKAAFYSLGIKCQQKIGLSMQNVANVKTYFADMIRSPSNGANYHVSQIFQNQSASNTTYDKEMYKRNKIKEHGFVPIWNNMLDHPEQKLVIDEIYYSMIWGCHYSGQDVWLPLKDPLTSHGLFDGKYNEVQKLILYQIADACGNDCCVDTIVGMKQIFRNGDTSVFGEITHVSRILELDGAYRIRDIEVRNNGTGEVRIANLRISLLKLDKNEWKNSAKDEYTFGCPSRNSSLSFVFAKQNYYIASIFSYIDVPPRFHSRYPMMNMGVAYLPVKSQLDSGEDEKNWKEWTC